MDILVVDDSGLMRTFIKTSLQSAGYEAEGVEPTSLFHVLEVMHRLHPRLLITDLEMPECQGEFLIQNVREDSKLRDTSIMVLSAHRESDLIERLQAYDLWAYALKPISMEDILERVRTCFQEHGWTPSEGAAQA